MKFITLVLFAFVALAAAGESASTWFRVANHLGTSLPAAIKFKACGLADSVYVNAKDSGRFGFGYDVAASSASGSYSMCSGGCDKKRDAELRNIFDERDDGFNPDAVYADNSAVNFMIYWSTNSDGSFSTADKIFTRITNGDVAYSLDTDCTLTVSNADDVDSYVTVSGSPVRTYPSANFQFLSDNHVVTQNWYYEQANPDYACSASSGTHNDVVTSFTAGASGTSYKTRVTFVFTDDAEASATGAVGVSIVDDGEGHLLQHIRSLNGASALGAGWISDIQVLVTDASDSNTIYINTSVAAGLPTSTNYQCNDIALTPTALKRKAPLASSSK